MNTATDRNSPPPEREGQQPAKTLQELIAEQGVADTAVFEHLLGRGADLWADDAEFDAFLQHLRAIRNEKD